MGLWGDKTGGNNAKWIIVQYDMVQLATRGGNIRRICRGKRKSGV